MAIGASEAETFWTEFLLAGRAGCVGVKLDLRDHKGCSDGSSAWQRCRVHFARNAGAPAARVGLVISDDHARPGRGALRPHPLRTPTARRSSGVRSPTSSGPRSLAALMDEAEHDVLAYMSFPKEHRQKLHSTNPIERLHAEVKRRTNVVGIFPNEDAITRLVGAILLEQNDEWAVSRRYMTLESIAPLGDGVPITLPTVAA